MREEEWERTKEYLTKEEAWNSKIEPTEIASYVELEEDLLGLIDLYLSRDTKDGYEKLYNLVGYIMGLSQMPIKLLKEVMDLANYIPVEVPYVQQILDLFGRYATGKEELLSILLQGICCASNKPSLEDASEIISNPIWDTDFCLTALKLDCVNYLEDVLSKEVVKYIGACYSLHTQEHIREWALKLINNMEID